MYIASASLNRFESQRRSKFAYRLIIDRYYSENSAIFIIVDRAYLKKILFNKINWFSLWNC
ncbi:hypothetical protein NARC_10134 [Candidatus Nitrosocosmicus arcticus]|uniref:Uncharacterized protein n=1 Tax=Candidatus Nitrosocosmicus arcticus TaxID=2035267 RepID=A0A557SYP8_9ARCH|nr:hypothetical protein NARC_10134 [Candidatus Nitrosocosmicus arcticus]